MGRVQIPKLKHFLHHWTKKFAAQRVPDPRSSAEYIVAHTLQKKTLHGVDLNSRLTQEQMSHAQTLYKMRLERVPVQYIIGEWDFCDLTLKMVPPVLIPRPETEELVGLCTHTVEKTPDKKNLFLEVGCGSGAISLALLRRLEHMHGVALDISREACNLTQENAERTGVLDRLTVVHADIQDRGVIERLQQLGPFDLVVSNPPYISTSEMEELQHEVRCYEDHQALHGGSDGMDIIKSVMSAAALLLKDQGHLWLEVGDWHAQLVQNLAEDSNTWLHSPQSLCYTNTVKDLYGKERFCHLIAS